MGDANLGIANNKIITSFFLSWGKISQKSDIIGTFPVTKNSLTIKSCG